MDDSLTHSEVCFFLSLKSSKGSCELEKKLSHRVKKPLTSPLPLQKRYPYIYPIYYLKFLHSHPPPTFLFVEQRKMMGFFFVYMYTMCVCKGRGREMMTTSSSSSSSSSGRFCRPPPLAEGKKKFDPSCFPRSHPSQGIYVQGLHHTLSMYMVS